MYRVLALLVLGVLLRVEATSSNGLLLQPPDGNSIEFRVTGKGVQIYSCNYSSQSWSFDRAKAVLYDTSTNIVVGHHYFLPRPDSNGGRATWALQPPDQRLPDSTVTGKALVNDRKLGTIDELLLQATSHTGQGRLSSVAYIQRLANIGGAAPPSKLCRVDGKRLAVEYKSDYVFWKQDQPSSRAVFVYFGEGFQKYTFNDSDWSLTNVSASLSRLPGDPVIGRHYFDQAGLPAWETTSPMNSRVTARPIKVIMKLTGANIAWLDLKTVSTSGDPYLFGSVDYVQRRSTRGGVKPTTWVRPAVKGDEFQSPYTAVYWFYAPESF